MSERITDDLTLDALGLALGSPAPARRAAASFGSRSQYASGDYQAGAGAGRDRLQHEPSGRLLGQRRRRELLRDAEVELVHNATWATRAVARTELFEYLELFYNGNGGIRRSGISAPGPSSDDWIRSIGSLTQVSTKTGQVHPDLHGSGTDARPGFCERWISWPIVGAATQGFYLCTLCAVDIATTWVELEASGARVSSGSAPPSTTSASASRYR